MSHAPKFKTPPSPRRTEFRRRLTVGLLTAGFVSILLTGGGYLALDLFEFRSSVLRRLEGNAAWVARNPEAFQRDPALAYEQAAMADCQLDAVALVDSEGEVLASWSDDESQVKGEPHSNWLMVQRPTGAGEDAGYVVVAGSWKPILVHALSRGLILLGLFAGSSVLTLFLVRRIHRRLSEQLLGLVHAANTITTREDYSIRAIVDVDVEVAVVAETFNHMLDRIEANEGQLREQVRRAEAARVAKSQFLATMSHEIRTPINGILGMTQLLLDTELDEDQDEYAQTVFQSTEGLLRIVNDVLDFSKGEAGRIEFEEIPFGVREVVDRSLATIKSLAADKGLRLKAEIDPRQPDRILGDPTRVRQVLLNLLGNAVKFTEAGQVLLRVRASRKDPGEVIFEVEDSGIGIPQDRIDRVFRSFSQVDASNNRRYGGTGLGLAISKQIVEGMGGRMFVESEEGKGSLFGFRVSLPEAEPEHGPAWNGPEGKRILVASPAAEERDRIASYLSETNETAVVASSTDAWRHLQQSARGEARLDLAILDERILAELCAGHGLPAVSDVPLVALSTPGRELETEGWSGETVTLSKPAERTALYWCICGLPGLDEVPPAPMPQGREPAPVRPASMDVLPGLHVLVVEDNVVNQKITTRFLEKLGVLWELAGNGEEALRAMCRKKFDLVLMDVQMPVLDGLEATRRLRALEQETGEHQPVVAMTANVLEEDRRLYEEVGFDDHLAKPVRFEVLQEFLGARFAPPTAEPLELGTAVAFNPYEASA